MIDKDNFLLKTRLDKNGCSSRDLPGWNEQPEKGGSSKRQQERVLLFLILMVGWDQFFIPSFWVLKQGDQSKPNRVPGFDFYCRNQFVDPFFWKEEEEGEAGASWEIERIDKFKWELVEQKLK